MSKVTIRNKLIKETKMNWRTNNKKRDRKRRLSKKLSKWKNKSISNDNQERYKRKYKNV